MQVLNKSPVSLLPRSCCHLLGLDSKRTHSRAAWWDTTPASRQDRSPRDIHMDRQLVRKCSRKHDSCLSFPPSPSQNKYLFRKNRFISRTFHNPQDERRLRTGRRGAGFGRFGCPVWTDRCARSLEEQGREAKEKPQGQPRPSARHLLSDERRTQRLQNPLMKAYTVINHLKPYWGSEDYIYYIKTIP